MKRALVIIYLVLVLIPVILGNLGLEAAENEELKLYKNFCYGDRAEVVFNKIQDDVNLLPMYIGNSYQEWLESEKYGIGGMLNLDAYYYMQAATKLLDRNFTCVFKIDKVEGILLGVSLYGPEYDFADTPDKEIKALVEMISKKYNEPKWKDLNEKIMETIKLLLHDYTWQYLWIIPSDEGKKEIRIGRQKRIVGNNQSKYSSILSIEYIKGKEEEVIKVDQGDLDDF